VLDDFVPYAWAHQVDRAQQWAHSLEDALTVLGDQLNVAQLRTTRARAETHRVRTELRALRATRTFRYTASLRTIYATLRRVFSSLTEGDRLAAEEKRKKEPGG
jgi:hypothetical protein